MGNKPTIAILVCVVIGIIIAMYSQKSYDAHVELKQSRADRANHVVQDQVWEVFCWDDELNRHSLRYVAPYKMSFEVEKGMCEALIK